MSAPTLLWLHIHRYAQFDDVRIGFSERENLILGLNGAGKTTLLELIQAVLWLDFGGLSSRAFDVEFELRTVDIDGAEMSVVGRVTNAPRATRGGAKDSPLGPPMELTASLCHRSAKAWIQAEVRGDEITYSLGNAADQAEKALLTRRGALKPNSKDLHDPTIRAAVENATPVCGANFLGESDREFRELSRKVSFTSDGPTMTIDTDAGNLEFGVLWELLPLLFNLGKLARDKFKDGLDLAATGTLPVPDAIEAAVFQRLFAPLGAHAVRLIPKVIREKGDKFECRGIDLSIEFLDGTKLSGEGLTFGQRRYLYAGVIFALHPELPVLVDELDNGLHPGLISALLESWQDRQLFLVSHNKLVIDHTNFAGPQDVQAKVHIVQRGHDGRQSILAFDEAAAKEVYDKIAVAIQSPSDVLSAEGFW